MTLTRLNRWPSVLQLQRQWKQFPAAVLCAVFVICTLLCPVWAIPAERIPGANVRVVINIPTRNLILYQNGVEVKRFQVGVGRPEFQTPIGQFSVIQMTLNPAWENPYLGAGQVRIPAGARNPLGTRWIGFKEDGKGQYGMHGTDNPKSVGQYSSHGCVRMFIKDAEELFSWVEYGTPVEVTYNPVVVQVKNNQLTAAVYPDRYRRGYPSVSDVLRDIQQSLPLANVDEGALASALRQPTGKPVVIGSLRDPMPTESTVPTEGVPGYSQWAPPQETRGSRETDEAFALPAMPRVPAPTSQPIYRHDGVRLNFSMPSIPR